MPTEAPPGIDLATAAWLLDTANPTVRRLAIDRLGLRDATDGERPRITDEPWVRAILREPDRPDGSPEPLHPYQKWGGVHWRLAWLAELEVPADDPAVAPVIADGFERVVAWLESPGRLVRADPVQGRTRMCASMDGLAGWAAVRNGLAHEDGMTRIVDRLVAWQWPDGGWNCDRRPESTHSSFNESWGPLRALAAYGASVPSGAKALVRDARAAADRATTFFLEHGVVNSHRTGRLAHPMVDGQRWPPYWHYDRLTGLRVLAESGRLGDERTQVAVADLRARASRDGRWRADRRFWRGPGPVESGVEQVDWTAEGSNKMLTIQALEVLRAAGAAAG